MEKVKILVVEDSAIDQKEIELCLRKFGYIITDFVQSGKEAIKKVEENKPDVVLMDIILQDEMDGIEVSALIRSRFDIPVIYITSYADNKMLERAKITEPFGYIVKPFKDRELHAIISMAIYKTTMEKKLKEYAAKMGELAEGRTKQLIHADKMIRLGTMSAGIAHEINNPTGFISSNLQIFESLWNMSIKDCVKKVLEEKEDKNLSFALDEMPRMVKTMIEGTNRISSIIKSMSYFSRIKEDSFSEESIYGCIENAIAFCKFDLSMKHMVDIQENLPEGLPNIVINKLEIEQVLINLFINAVHAMVKIKDIRKPTLIISAVRKENHVVVEVSDNGCGMDKITLDNIFNPFFTTKKHEKGTGLGLYICHEIIRKHRGKIIATSTQDEGTTFTITLPVKPETQEREVMSEKSIR